MSIKIVVNPKKTVKFKKAEQLLHCMNKRPPNKTTL